MSFSRPSSRLLKTQAVAISVLAAATMISCEKKHQTPPPMGVVVVDVKKMDVPVLKEWIGTTDGSINATIHAQLPQQAYLMQQNYKEGSLVKEGQILFTLDRRQLQAALDKAKADLEIADAQEMKSRLDMEKYSGLIKTGAVSQKELDDSVQQNRSDRATVDANKAALESAKLNFEWTLIKSPITGLAGKAVAQVGDLIAVNSEMTSVSKIDPIKIIFPITENEYLTIAKHEMQARKDSKGLDNEMDNDLDLTLVLNDGSTYPHSGKTSYADRQVDQKTGTITVFGFFPNPDYMLRPGLYAKVRSQVFTRKGVMVVPFKAILDMQGTEFVIVVGSDNKVDFRKVEEGGMTPDHQFVVITSGLKEGERVITDGLQKVRADMIVNPMTPEQAKEASAAALKGKKTVTKSE